MGKWSETRVLHLIDSSEIAGGERYLLDLIRHSGSSFTHIVALSYDGPLAQQLRDRQIPHFFVGMRSRLSIRSIFEIRKHIQTENISIVHTHGYRCNLYGRLACLFQGIRNIATVHVSLYDYVDTPPWLRRIYLQIEKLTSFMTSRYICISKAMRDDLHKLGIPEEKTVVIHNGVDLDVFYPREPDMKLCDDLKIGPNRPVIGTVGRMETEKGQVHLIDALPALLVRWPKLRCLFIGKGSLQDELKKRAAALGLAEICIFPGVRMDIADVYPLMDLFVLPSPREPFGLVLLEAMATGVPVIATSSGGPLDFIQSMVNGILVPPAEPVILASQIDFMLSNHERSHAIAQKGCETIRKHYDIRKTVEEIERLYHACDAKAEHMPKHSHNYPIRFC